MEIGGSSGLLRGSHWVPMAEVTRGARVESMHHGAIAVWGPGGLEYSAGSPNIKIFPRSAIKPLQALPLIESGAAHRFGLSNEHVAVACSSHNGEPRHTALVEGWLHAMGLKESNLACGSHWPTYFPTMLALAREGNTPSQLHNNCSGKHAGFLCTALYANAPLEGYEAIDHPAQRAWRDVVCEMSEEILEGSEAGFDGCAIPTYPVSLAGIARASAKMAEPEKLGPVRRGAIERIKDAMAAHPFLVAGSDRFCTTVIKATEGKILVKTGAEGVFAGLINGYGLGFALKIADGASRASEIATIALLMRLLGDDPLARRLAPFQTAPVVTRKGIQAGEVRPVVF